MIRICRRRRATTLRERRATPMADYRGDMADLERDGVYLRGREKDSKRRTGGSYIDTDVDEKCT